MRAFPLIVVTLLLSCAGTRPSPSPLPSAPPTPSAAATTTQIERVLPLVGKSRATDAFGYPTAHVDRVELHAMLRDNRFAELTAAFEAAQFAFEEDWHNEYWAHDTVEAFTADPTLAPLFDAWIEATPTSFAPYAARGAWLCDLGLDARGADWAADTPEENFEKMRALHARGVADLVRALELRPQSVAVARVLVTLGTRSSSLVDTDAVMERALASCPNCLHIRVANMINLEPRWGGSYEEMGRFAADAMKGTSNERLAVLAGYAFLDRAQMSRNLEEKRSLLDQAIAHGDASDFYRERAEVRARQRDEPGALADSRKVVELRPTVGLNHAALAVRLAERKDWREAERVMRHALALDSHGPTLGFRRSFLGVARKQVNDPFAPRELLDFAAAFETDPQRLEDLRRRREGRTTLLAAVEEPAAWAQEPPGWAALADLLDDAEHQSAAWCRLLERAIREDKRERYRFHGARCEVEVGARAQASDGTTVHVVLPRAEATGLDRPYFLVASNGAVLQTRRGRSLTPRDSAIVALGGERKAIVSTFSAPAGRRHRTQVLQVEVLDTIARPPLRVALGGPRPANEASTPSFDWRVAVRPKANDVGAIELVTRDEPPKVVATFTWNDAKAEWRGPEGEKALGFRRLPANDSRALDAWNVEHDGCATLNVDPIACAH